VNKSSRAAPSARSRGASDETYQLDRRGANEHATLRSGCAADLFTTSEQLKAGLPLERVVYIRALPRAAAHPDRAVDARERDANRN